MVWAVRAWSRKQIDEAATRRLSLRLQEAHADQIAVCALQKWPP